MSKVLLVIGAVGLLLGTIVQMVRASDGVFWNRKTRKAAFADNWSKDAEMWGWVALFFGALLTLIGSIGA